ncbi:MAG: tetratricopeptide repeat protein [Pseudomonadota bacterium]
MRGTLAFLLILALSGYSLASENQTSDIEERMSPGELRNNEADQPQTRSPIDMAYGAYQRGWYLTAFQLALPRAQNGDAAAQTLIAELYDKGLGIARDPKESASWYALAAEAKNREAQFVYGMKLIKGTNISRDLELGVQYLQEAAEAGHPLAQFNYANHLIDQRPTSATYRIALPLYERAAENRVTDAVYALAAIYREGLATGINDMKRAIAYLKRAAADGHDTAQVELGIELLKAEYIEKDNKQALRWFRLAAGNGNAIAQNRLSHMLFEGIGTKADPVAGAKWHIIANRAGRRDPQLDFYLNALSKEERNKAVKEADRWPSSAKELSLQ